MSTAPKMPPYAVEAGDGVADLLRDLDSVDLQPLWTITRELLTDHPQPRSVPWLWQSSTLMDLARRSLHLIPVDRGGERRVLSLRNPGLEGAPYAVGTLWGAIQCLGAGETAPAHRHSPGAIRFVLAGDAVATTVDGDACDMHPGDLVLTPSWNWHEHTSVSDEPMFWFDGLDLPLVEMLDAIFFEPYPEFKQPEDGPHNKSELAAVSGPRYAPGAVTDTFDTKPSPLLVYRWADTDRELEELLAGGEPMVTAEYVNPETGAAVLPTMSCAAHRIRPGGHTAATRRTGSSVFVAYRGSGHTVIEGERFDWAQGDMFVVPSWAAVEHVSADGADLFSISDAPVLRALGIYREQELDGPQEVASTFVPARIGGVRR